MPQSSILYFKSEKGSQELSDFKRSVYQNKTLMLIFLFALVPSVLNKRLLFLTKQCTHRSIWIRADDMFHKHMLYQFLRISYRIHRAGQCFPPKSQYIILFLASDLFCSTPCLKVNAKCFKKSK